MGSELGQSVYQLRVDLKKYNVSLNRLPAPISFILHHEETPHCELFREPVMGTWLGTDSGESPRGYVI